MIQIYDKGNTNFSKNGDVILKPESCTLRMELNGAWTVELIHPADNQGRYKKIESEAVLKVPTPYGDKLFRIYDTDRTPEEITAYARPIFMDAAHEVFIVDKRPTNKNVKQTLDILMEGTRYTGESNITRTETAYYEFRNLINCISGDQDNAIIRRWGGEILYDDYKIIINERIGGDYGAMAIAGKNLAEIEERIVMDDLITRIFPKAYNGYKLDGTGYVDSPKRNLYSIIYAQEVEYSDVKMQSDCQEGETGFATLLDLRAELRRRAEKDFENGVDLPTVEMTINMLDLSKRRECKEFKNLETVRLGDTVHVRHKKMEITMTSRVISLEYDCIRKKNGEIVLGKHVFNYFSNLDYIAQKVDGVVRRDGSLVADRVQGIMNASEVQLKAQKDVARRQDARAILFEDLDEDSPLYGALAIGTQGLEISKKRTADGLDWEWTTAITSAGVIADAVITGLLSDKTAKNFWNLDTGDFMLSSDTRVDGKTLNQLLNDNLLLGGPDFNSQYFQRLQVNRTDGYTDPYGGNEAVKITAAAGATNGIFRAYNTTNKPIKETGRYTLTYWARANGTYDRLATRFNDKVVYIGLDQVWKEYKISVDVEGEEDITTLNSQFQIGGASTFTESSMAKDVYIEDDEGLGEFQEYAPLEVYLYDAKVKKEYSASELLQVLTRDGEVKGIYQMGDQLYISMTYILGGGMKLGGASNGNGEISVYDAENNLIAKINKEGVVVAKGRLNISAEGQEYTNQNFISMTGTNYSVGAKTRNAVLKPDSIAFTGGNYNTTVGAAGVGMTEGSNRVNISPNFGGLIDCGGLIQTVDLQVSGTKSRVVEAIGEKRLLYAYETPTPYFGDLGTGRTDENGMAMISIDFDFRDTIEETEYNVFIQEEGEGRLYVIEKESDFFTVKGTPNLKFSWHLFAPQKDFSMYRLDEVREKVDYEDNFKESIEDEFDFENDIDFEMDLEDAGVI